jgi:hypothetical protein
VVINLEGYIWRRHNRLSAENNKGYFLLSQKMVSWLQVSIKGSRSTISLVFKRTKILMNNSALSCYQNYACMHPWASDFTQRHRANIPAGL